MDVWSLPEEEKKALINRLVLSAAAAGVLWYGGGRIWAVVQPQQWEQYRTLVEEHRLAGVAVTAGVIFLASLAVKPLPPPEPSPVADYAPCGEEGE